MLRTMCQGLFFLSYACIDTLPCCHNVGHVTDLLNHQKQREDGEQDVNQLLGIEAATGQRFTEAISRNKY